VAAAFNWCEDNGVGPATTTSGVTNVNWKNADDTTTPYSSAPIGYLDTSYDKWQYGMFYGTFTQISNGKWAHTAGSLDATAVTLKGAPAGNNQLGYTTPALGVNISLIVDMTAVTAIGSGVPVYFGPTSPNTIGKATSGTANPLYTNYLTTQMQTNGSTAAGDCPTVTITLQYDEN